MTKKYKLIANSEEYVYDYFIQLRSKLRTIAKNISIPQKEEFLFANENVEYLKNKLNIEISTYEEEDTPVTPTLEEAKAEKTSEIQRKSDDLIAQIKSGYTSGEIATFEQQFQGANDILDGNLISTNATFVLGLLAERLGHNPSSEEMTTFCELVQNNYFTAASATGKILGKQQNLEIQVRNATTIEEVEAVVWADE